MIAGMNQKGCYGGFKTIQDSRPIGLMHFFLSLQKNTAIPRKIDGKRYELMVGF